MASISGTIRDSKGSVVPDVSVLLIRDNTKTLATVSRSDGSFTFTNLPLGIYRLSAIFGNSIREEEIEILDVSSDTNITINVQTSLHKSSSWQYLLWNRYVLLKYFQYGFLAIIGWVFFKRLIVDMLPSLSLWKLNDIETARGAITYLITVTTLSMAALLMLATIMTGGKDLDKRFGLGKEIVTILVGILGTIVGFYFGTSTKSPVDNSVINADLDTLLISRSEKQIIINGMITGGVAPFVYSISSDPKNAISNVSNITSESGQINDTLYIYDEKQFKTSHRLTLAGKDKNGLPFSKTQSVSQ